MSTWTTACALAVWLPLAGCGGPMDEATAESIVRPGDPQAIEVGGGVATLEVPIGSAIAWTQLLSWWHSALTWQSMSYGWHDTDLAVGNYTPIQLRHASRLVGWGTYGWGYMPTFVDLVTGHRFRFLHLHPQYERATYVGRVYPAGYVVGYSGGGTWDTGGAGRGFSTGPHLCVQTLVPYRVAFPW